jgi:hypothetical protein
MIEPRGNGGVGTLPADVSIPNGNPCRRRKWLHENRIMRIVSHVNRLHFSEESKKKLWRPCREARALGL